MPDASLALFADLGACHVQKSSVTICFLPAPSRWRATPHLALSREFVSYFYPRPPGGGRPRRRTWLSAHCPFLSALPVKRYRRSISIHALRVEGDPALFRLPISFPNFYPRPPGGGRLFNHKQVAFLSHFYPRPPGGGRLPDLYIMQRGGWISIHALRVEGDTYQVSG